MKKVKRNQQKIVFFTAVKNRCMLHGRVFVMKAAVSRPQFEFEIANGKYILYTGHSAMMQNSPL